MMYRVIKFFTDKQDNGYAYNVGDIFPRNGFKVSEKRLAELLGNNNRQRTPMIEKVETKSDTHVVPVQAEKPVQEILSENNIKENKVEVKKTNKRSRSKKDV